MILHASVPADDPERVARVLGEILGGGQYGGLFAINFKVAGRIAAPVLTVNPLSAIAPGFLRKIFEFQKDTH